MADTLDFDTPLEDLPTFRSRFYYDRVVGQPYALWLNAKLILDMGKRPAGYNYMHPDSFWSAFTDWIRAVRGHNDFLAPKLSFSGKNFGTFDSRFLWKLPRWDREYFKSRVLDPGQFFLLPTDAELPDLKTCIARAGIAWDESRHHDAIEDARMVVALNRVGLGQQWRDLTRLPELAKTQTVQMTASDREFHDKFFERKKKEDEQRAIEQNKLFGTNYSQEG